MSDHPGVKNIPTEEGDDQDSLLQSALAAAFTSPPLVRKAPSAPQHAPPPAAAGEGASEDPGAGEPWRAEYDAQLLRWRADSAAARARAEAERARWEARRTAERAAGGSGSWEALDVSSIAGPPNPHFPPTAAAASAPGPAPAPAPSQPELSGSPSPADVRDRVAGERQGGAGRETLEAMLPPAQGPLPAQTPLDDSRHSSSHKWEEVPSMESSFPSLSFPDLSASRSPERHAPRAAAPASGPEPRGGAPPSATLSVFDGALPPRARALALVSALVINFVLPFVNGVMLGAGEIFAKTLLGRLGWARPGGAATALGVGAAPQRRR